MVWVRLTSWSNSTLGKHLTKHKLIIILQFLVYILEPKLFSYVLYTFISPWETHRSFYIFYMKQHLERCTFQNGSVQMPEDENFHLWWKKGFPLGLTIESHETIWIFRLWGLYYQILVSNTYCLVICSYTRKIKMLSN